MSARPLAGFVRLGSDRDATVGELALALGGAFGPVDLATLEDRLGGLARRLAPARSLTPWRQLRHVSDVLADALAVCPGRPPALDDLLYHRVAVTGHGHALACLLVAIEAGRRAGLELGLVASSRHLTLALPALQDSDVIVPDRGWDIVDARRLHDESLAWMCPHEAASMWLVVLREAALAQGCPPLALQALELQLQLPVTGRERRRLERLRVEVASRARDDGPDRPLDHPHALPAVAPLA